MSSLPVPVAPADEMSGDLVPSSPAFEAAFDSAKGYASVSKAERTVRAYRGAFEAFRAWCAGVDAAPLPASVATTAGYLASLADRGCKASTIDLHAAAIAFAHRAGGHEPPTNSMPVKAVIRGIRRTIGTKVTRKAPATADTLKKMLRRIPDGHIGKRDRALLLLGFAAALRRSELAGLQVTDLERSPEGIIVHIARSKTDRKAPATACRCRPARSSSPSRRWTPG